MAKPPPPKKKKPAPPAPKGKAPPAPKGKAPPPPSAASIPSTLPPITSGPIARPQRIVLYGTAKIGKSKLASLLPNPVFLDLEDGTADMQVNRVTADNLMTVRAYLQSDMFDDFGAIVLDSGTALMPFVTNHVLATKTTEKGTQASSIEDYGWGKGYRHAFDAYNFVLADLDRHIREGRHVCVILHSEPTKAPNPEGDDWLRYEPALQNHSSGNIRNRIVQWADHVLFMGYDVLVRKPDKNKIGKGTGAGTRTLYPAETPTMLAGSRRLRNSLPVIEGDASVWEEIIR